MAFGNDMNFDLKDIRSIIAKRKWLIIIPLILATGAAYGISFLLEPQYESYAIVSVSEDVALSSELQRLIGMEQTGRQRDSERRERLNGYYNELTSTLYLSQLVDQLGLGNDPSLTEEAQRLAAMSPGADPNQIRFNLIQDDLQARISVNYAAQDQIEITALAGSAMQATNIANTLSDIFISEKLKQDLATIRTGQDFSDVQLQRYERQLQEKVDERTRLEQQILNIQLDPAITSESNRTAIGSEIEQTEVEVQDLRRTERELLSSLSGVDGITTTNLQLQENADHSELRDEVKQILRQLTDRMATATWSNPQILNLKLRLNAILDGIKQANRTEVERQYSRFDQSVRDDLLQVFNNRTELEYLYSKTSYLRASLGELTDKMNMVPEYQARLDQLDEEIAAAQVFRDRFKRQTETSSISQALLQDASSAKYKVVEPAKLPLAPSKPNRKQIALMGLVIGLVLGVGAAVVSELLDSSLKKVEEVEDFLGLKVLGITPKADFMKKVG